MVRRLLVTVIALFLIGAGSSHATTINYTTSDLGGGAWQYQYTVSNNSLVAPIEEFTVYFPYDLADNLNAPLLKTGWDQLTVQRALAFDGTKFDGYYDALSLTGGIPVSASESGFTVNFTWLGQGTPGSQYFEVVDPNTLDVLDSGDTTPSAAVPEPSVLLLLASGCPALLFLRRRL